MYVKVRKIVYFWLLVSIAVTCSVNAYELDTHELMTKNAFGSSKLATGFLADQLGIKLEQRFNGRTGDKWMEDGSRREDDYLSGGLLSPVHFRFRNHFWDPHFQ